MDDGCVMVFFVPQKSVRKRFNIRNRRERIPVLTSDLATDFAKSQKFYNRVGFVLKSTYYK